MTRRPHRIVYVNPVDSIVPAVAKMNNFATFCKLTQHGMHIARLEAKHCDPIIISALHGILRVRATQLHTIRSPGHVADLASRLLIVPKLCLSRLVITPELPQVVRL